MNTIMTEHDVRDAVQGIAAHASAPPLPGQEILRAGARRRVRRRAERAGALAMAATAVAAVAWTQTSGGSSVEPGDRPTVTNTFTDQLGQVLGQILPGTKVSASMYGDTVPRTRHRRSDIFPLQITYRGHVLDASLFLEAGSGATTALSDYCQITVPETKMSGCTSKPLAGGGLVGAYRLTGPGQWGSGPGGPGGKPLTTLTSDIMYSQMDATHVGVSADLRVRAGTTSNDSGLTPAALSTAFQDPRFTTFLRDFADHPDQDPYGPLAKINDKVVASGKVGDHTWELHFATISEEFGPLPAGKVSSVDDNCDYWEVTVDGGPLTGNGEGDCQIDHNSVHNPPPTDKSGPWPSHLVYPAWGVNGHAPQQPVGTVLTSTVPAGTVSVEATFDDQPAKLTGKAFTVHGDIPYFALVKPDGAKPDWKLATVVCRDAAGKVVGTLFFKAP